MVLNLLKAHPWIKSNRFSPKALHNSSSTSARGFGTQAGRSARSDGTLWATRLHRLDHRVADFRPGPPTEVAPYPHQEARATGSRRTFSFSHPRSRGRPRPHPRSGPAAISQQGAEEPDDYGTASGRRHYRISASTVTEVSDRVFDCVDAPVYPWCTPESVEELLRHLQELPGRLPELPSWFRRMMNRFQTLSCKLWATLPVQPAFSFRLSSGLPPRV